METITIIAIIVPVITGFIGTLLGHKLACSRIKQEINEIEEKDKRTENRHKEEKFENAIDDYYSTAYSMKEGNEELSKYENFARWYSTCKNCEQRQWLCEHNIQEITDFYKWLKEKAPDHGFYKKFL